MTLVRMALVVAVCLQCAVAFAASPVPPKFALVIGNAAYPDKARLANTTSDSNLMANTFRDLGYQTTLLQDADLAAMMRAVAQLADNVKGGGVAALYFAGHGLQLANENYLLPIGLPPLTQKLVRDDAYPLQHAIDRLRDSGAQVSLIIVDACRNVPYGWGYRSLEEEGLAAPKPAKGMLIAYSTAPGQLALDGKPGSNSPFTAALAVGMRQPGVRVDEVFNRVRSQVREQTRDEQQPWISTSLIGDFYFAPAVDRRTKLAAVQSAPTKPRGDARHLPEPEPSKTRPALSANLEWFQLLKHNELIQLYKEMERTAQQLTPDDLPRLSRKARAGNVIAQTTLGIAYRDGLPPQWRSNPKAVKWFRAAANQGYAIAQNELGEMYYKGRGVDMDVPASIRLFEAASKSGYVVAKFNLLQARGNKTDERVELIRHLFYLN